MAGRTVLVFLVSSSVIQAAPSVATITLSNVTSVASTIITQSSSSASSSQASSSTTQSNQASSSTTPSTSQGFLSPKPPSSYEVTENVIDIPDDRPKPPTVTNFSLFKPLNLANTNVTINKITKNDTGDEHHQPKKTSITYVHICKENGEGGIKRLFKGFKDYVFGLKRGVVDGLHKYFHKHDGKNEKSVGSDEEDDDFRNFHRNFHSDENFDDGFEHAFKHGHEFEDY